MLPEAAVRWAGRRVPGGIREVRPVDGGITNTKWVLRAGADDALFVLRWSDPAVWADVGSEHVRREAIACRLLAGAALPVPRLVAHDPDGAAAGGPANLLTWLPGRSRLDPLSEAALEEAGRLAAAVHGFPIAEPERPPAFGLRGPRDPQVPEWTRRPSLWRRAIAIVSGSRPAPTRVGLLHRDFHLGNLLWLGDQVNGLIDWADVSWGPADLDVAHFCSDLAMMHDVIAAAAFRDVYLKLGGRLDPDRAAARFWLVADIVGFLPDPAHILPAVVAHRPDLTADRIRQRLEDWLSVVLD